MSNTQKKNVPELRFPGFEGEWEEKKLEDIGTLKNGINKDKESFGYGFPFVNLNDVFNSREIQIKNLSLINSTYKEREEYNLQKGDTLFIRSSVKPSGVGLTKVIEIDLKNVVFSGFLIRFRNNNLAVNFKKFIFNSISVRKQILSLSSTSANTNINQESLKKVKIPIPCMDEQQKIGRFFSKLDRQIELEEQKLELLQQQKKGYMQKIFSQELRFKDENGNNYPDWEEKKIEDIASQVYGGGTPNTKIKEFWNGDIPWIQSSDVKVNDLILQQCNKFISKNSIELSSAKLIPANSIAIVTRVGVGKLCLVEFDYATSQDFLSLSSLKYDKLYSLYSLLYTMKKISANLQGTSIKGITKKELLDSIIKIPHNLEEQQKIGELFYKIDKYISFNKCKIEMLKSLKQGLLQKMFI
ncbi:TPA: restriction endonuclease subunit S [Staphylococcus aureus]|nr:restriction endonuclease subunit S [Staphylococcus aureus]